MPPKRRGKSIQKKVVKPISSQQQEPKRLEQQPEKQSLVQTLDLSDLLVLASVSKTIVDLKPASEALNLLALYNKVQIQNTTFGPQINIEGIQITINKGVLIAHFHEGNPDGYEMGSKFPMVWLKELQQLRREIVKRQFLEKAKPEMNRLAELFNLTPLTPINIIGDGICRTFSYTEITEPNDPLSGTIVLSFYRKAQQMVVYLSLARIQYELIITDDETLKKSFQQFIVKIKEERKKKL
jgi:hypothetical protein